MQAFIHPLLASQNSEAASITSNMGWIWVGRPNYAYSESAQKYWVGIVEGEDQHVIQYDILNDVFINTKIGGVMKEKDDHNQPSLLIRSSDNRLVAVYNIHLDRRIRVRISTNPSDSSSWGPETTLDLNSVGDNFELGYSYSSIYQASDGAIYLVYRHRRQRTPRVHETWEISKSTDGGVTFQSPVTLIDNGIFRPYSITCQDGDKIHFTVTSASPQTDDDVEINIFHFYFDMVNETVHGSDSATLTAPLNDTEMTSVQYIPEPDRSWIVDIATKNGRPRILYTKYVYYVNNNYADKDLYYIEWDGSAWVNNSKLFDVLDGQIEDDENIQSQSYMPAARFDTVDSNIIWISKQVNGVLEIHKYELLNDYLEQLTFDSPVDQWRPISIPCKNNNLLWLSKTYYDHWLVEYDNTLKAMTVNR